MVQKKLPLKTSSTIKAEEKIYESSKAIVEDELNQEYDKLFKDISEVRRITPEHVLNDIVNVQPMADEEFKKFSKNSLFKINHINKDDENQKPI